MSDAGERPKSQTHPGVIGAFVSCAQAHPERVALIQDDQSLSYAELDRRSKAVAGALAERGIGRGHRVQIVFGRSLEFIVALIGVARSGAAYVPIDPEWPAERRRALERVSQPSLSILSETLATADETVSPREIGIEQLIRDGAAPAGAHLSTPPTSAHGSDDPFYVMFTSGTTGDPKGVVVPHRAVARLVLEPDFLDTKGTRCWLHLAATSFDAATLEVWMPLVRGHTIAIVPDAVPSLDRIAGVIRDAGVTDAWLTASLFNAVVDLRPDAFAPMKQVLTGGERVSPDHAARFLKQWPGIRLINGYGPTENTTFTCCHTITLGDTERPEGIPIGRPISGTTIRIVGPDMRDVPPGEPGELLAGGEGVALGYLNDARLTESRFVADPDGTWYRTGDLVRRDAFDAPIVYLGRTDRQVKVRGHRIELDEVEQAMCTHPGVSTAFAAALGDSADRRELVAGYEPVRADQGVRPDGLRRWMLDRYPKSIIPDRLVVLERVPVGPNGKADRGAIERQLMLAARDDNDASPTGPEQAGPDSQAWARFASLIREIFPGVSFDEKTRFIEIGGHSLAALRLSALVRERLGADLPLHEILSTRSLGELAGCLRPSDDGAANHVCVIGDRPHASSIQRQFFFENAVDPTGIAYLEHAGFIVQEEGFSTLRVSQAFASLVARHEALRTRLILDGDALVQQIEPSGEGAMSRVTIHEPIAYSSTRNRTDEIAEAVRAVIARPFDLEREWPVRLDLFPLKAGAWAVVLSFQHAAIDEWSLRILADELARLYDQPEAPLSTPVRYAAYSTREASRIASADPGSVAETLRSVPRPTLRLGRAPAQSVEHRIPWIDPDEITALAYGLNATPTAVACGAYAAAIARVTGLNRVAMLTPISRRLDADEQRIVGCCNTMHAVIVETLDPNSVAGCERIIASASESFAEAYANPLVPFDAVARALHAGGLRDHTAVPFGFAYETNPPFCPAFGSMRAEPLPIRSAIARFPLGLSIDTRESSPIASFSTPKSEGARESVALFADAFRVVVEELRASRAEGEPFAGVQLPPSHTGLAEQEAKPTSRGGCGRAPETGRAREIASEAWTAIVGAPPAGDQAHFFESGGHSLILLRLAARIRVEGGVEIPLGSFLDEPTFGTLVSLVSSRAAEPDAESHAAGFQIEEFGDGNRVVVCIPGAFGRPISFGKIAEEFAERNAGIRLRCYNVFDAMSGNSVPEGFESVLAQLKRDFQKPETAGMLGFCAGGLYPLFLGAIPESRMRRLRLWLLNVFATDPPDQWLSLRLQSMRDAAKEPSGYPAAARDSLITLWRMLKVRLRSREEGVSGDQFTHAELQRVLARRSLGVWRGGSTVLIAGRKPVWRTYYRNSRLNGLADKLQGPTRTVVLPLMHHELLTSGAAAIADAIELDIGASTSEATE